MTRIDHLDGYPAVGDLARLQTVRLSITQLSPAGDGAKDVILGVEGDERQVIDTLWAWAAVRGYDSLTHTAEHLLTQPPPTTGFTAILHKPDALLILLRWSWAPPARTLSF